MAHSFNEARLSKFIELSKDIFDGTELVSNSIRKEIRTNAAPKGKKPKSKAFAMGKIIAALPDEGQTRDTLTKLIKNENTQTRLAIFAILGWGHISAKSLRGYIASKADEVEEFEDYVDQIRTNRMPRAKAYDLIAQMRKGTRRNGWRLHGIGVAYFTKVIFFFTRGNKKPGYIMDQFTARSMIYLRGKKCIKMDSGTVVTDRNNGTIYEEFCASVEELAAIVSKRLKREITPEQVEMALFSGRGGPWRNYRKRHPGRTYHFAR